MVQAAPTQTNFTGGELSPRLLGRTDLKKYNTGARELLNALVQVHGGYIRRSGTRFLNEVKDTTRLTLLNEFQFSTEQTYILEIGHLYIRFYRDRGQLKFAGVPTEIVTTYTETELRSLKYEQSNDVLYITHPDPPVRKLQRDGLGG